jgi:hypothetical protein
MNDYAELKTGIHCFQSHPASSDSSCRMARRQSLLLQNRHSCGLQKNFIPIAGVCQQDEVCEKRIMSAKAARCAAPSGSSPFINHAPTISSSGRWRNASHRADAMRLGNKINRFMVLLHGASVAWALL